MAEMATGRPLFPGSAPPDQLLLIFKVLGTLTPARWPGVTACPDYNNGDFPIHESVELAPMFPKLNESGIDLLEMLLEYNPDMRISATNALLRTRV